MVDVARDKPENPRRNSRVGTSSEERLSTFNTRETGAKLSLPSSKFTSGAHRAMEIITWRNATASKTRTLTNVYKR